MDALIAQVCLSNDVPLFTLDKHFEAIQDLRIWRWKLNEPGQLLSPIPLKLK